MNSPLSFEIWFINSILCRFKLVLVLDSNGCGCPINIVLWYSQGMTREQWQKGAAKAFEEFGRVFHFPHIISGDLWWWD